MNHHKTLLRTRPANGFTNLLTFVFLFGICVAQNENQLTKVTSKTLAEEQLLGIVKKHETLLGQYEENPAKFEARELSSRVQSVISAYKAFNEDNPNDVFGYVLHGKFLREIGQFDAAFKLFQQANELDPNIAIVKQQLGNYLAESGKYKEAYSYFFSAASLDPEKAVYQYQLGAHLILFRKQLLDEDILKPSDYDKQLSRSLSEAVRLAPEELKYKRLYAESFYDLQKPNWDKALKTWSSLLVQGITDTEAQAIHLHRARIMAQLGREDEARDVLAGVTHPALAATKRKVTELLGKSDSPVPPTTPKPTPPVSAENKKLQAEVQNLRKELAELKKTPVLPKPDPIPAIPIEHHNKVLTELRGKLRNLETEKSGLMKELIMARSKLDDKAKSISLVKHNQVLSALKKELDESGKVNISVKNELSKVADTLDSTQKMLQLVIAERDVAKNDLNKQVKKTEDSATHFAKEKEELLSQMEGLRKDSSAAARKMAADLQNQLVQLNAERDDLAKTKEKQSKEIEFLNKELANFEGKLLSMMDSKSKTERQQANAIKGHIATIESLRKELGVKEEANKDLVDTVAEKTRDTQELRKKLQDSSLQAKKYREMGKFFESAVDDFSINNLDVLESLKVVSKQRLLKLEDTLAEEVELNKKLTVDLTAEKVSSAKLDDEINKLIDAAKTRDAELKRLVLQNKEESRQMKLSLAEKTKGIDTLEMQLVDSRSQVAALGKKLAKSLKVVESGQKQISALSNSNKKLEADSKVLQARYEDAVDKLASGKGEIAIQMAKAEKFEENLISTQKLLADRDSIVADLQKRLNQSESVVEGLQKSSKESSRVIEKLSAEHDTLTSQNAELLPLSKKYQKAENELAKAKSVIIEQSRKIADYTEDSSLLEETYLSSINWVELLTDELESSIEATEYLTDKHEEQIQLLEQRLKVKDKYLSDTKSESDGVLQELEKARALLKVGKSLQADTENTVSDLQKANKALSLDLAQARKTIETTDKLTEAQNAKITKMVQSSQLQDATIAQYQKEAKAQVEKSKDLEKLLADLKNDEKVYLREINTIKSELEVAENQLTAAQAALKAREQAYASDQEVHIITLELLIEDLTSELLENADASSLNDLFSEVEALRDELSSSKKSSAEILQSMADLKQENAELSNQASQVKVLTLKLEASVTGEAEALEMVQSLRDENAQLSQQSKAYAEKATEPLQQELLVAKEKANSLTRQLKEMDKDNKFLSAELKSLEDSLLSTLDKHSRVEKLSNEKVADLQKQLEHAQKALIVMKNAMVETPDKSVMVDLDKKAALLNVYERQINELQASNAVLKSQLADNEDAFRKQLVVLDEKLKSSETERKSDNSLLRAQENEMVQMKANLADLKTQLKVARVPDLAQVEQLRNQLKIEKDTSDSLRTRLKTSDVEKLEMSEQLVLANSDLGRHRQLLFEMKSKVEDLSQTKSDTSLHDQMKSVRQQLDGYQKSAASRQERLIRLEAELAQARHALEKKKAGESAFAAAYKSKLLKIVSDSAKLQDALEIARNDLVKSRNEKSKAISDLTQENTLSSSKIRELQGQLDALQSEVEKRPSASSRERDLLARTIERLSKSENTIKALEASLSTAQSKNRKFALTQAKLLAELEDQQQISSSPSGDKARIDQLERALGDSQAKLAKRDKDFEDIVAKMNRILDRLHTNPIPTSP